MQVRIYQAGWKILDFLFPPNCAGCGSWGEKYCPNCLNRTQLISQPICRLCGYPLNHTQGGRCQRCCTQPPAFTAIRSWAIFSQPIQSAIHRLKYYRDRGLGVVLAQPLGNLLRINHWKIDLILPVPLDRKRQKERGYNQAALLAKPVSWITVIPYSDQALLKPKPTRHQVGLSLGERKENLVGAFNAQEEIVRGLNIVVVDDVMTTGATINACAQALIEGGANRVYGLTLARSLHAFGD